MFGIFENHHNLYSWFPKMEKTTFDISLVHFSLMFGYKLFSLYYPLFLVSIGLSVMNVGGIYLLTYSTIAVSSIVINRYIYKFNPAKIASAGIFGYGIFALMMLLSQNLIIFYSAQIILGVSASAWLVSLKLLLMKSETDSYNRSFGWFYSMPHYAAVIAPIAGGLIIYKFGFVGVFALSVVIQFLNAPYAYFKLRKYENGARQKNNFGEKYKEVFEIIKGNKTFAMILASIFCVLILGGIYRTFFVLFLKDLSFSQKEIIWFISLASIAYLPLSLVVIKIIERLKHEKAIMVGMIVEGFASVIIGSFSYIIGLAGIFSVMIFDSLGSLSVGSGKSSFLAKKFKNHKEEASTIDTVIATLGPAIGGLVGGIAISFIGFQDTFLIGGVVVIFIGLIVLFLKSED